MPEQEIKLKVGDKVRVCSQRPLVFPFPHPIGIIEEMQRRSCIVSCTHGWIPLHEIELVESCVYTYPSEEGSQCSLGVVITPVVELPGFIDTLLEERNG